MSMITKANPREIYGKKLVELGETNPQLVALAADVTSSNKFQYFAQRFPERFFNVGIAEQNMVGIAAGLALSGKVPVATSFAPFLSMRACEQVRTDVCYVNLPVKLIGTCCGVSGGKMGSTHAALEDIAIMRNMPNMTVVAPSDPMLCGDLLEQMITLKTPAYMRVGRGEDPVLYATGIKVNLGKAIVAKEGSDATIIACGVIVYEALLAAKQLEKDGIHVRVLDMHTIKPIDREQVIAAAKETSAIVTAEDHFITGGLGTAVAEVLSEAGIGVKLCRLGIPDLFPIFGDGPDLYRYYGTDSSGIAKAVRNLLEENTSAG